MRTAKEIYGDRDGADCRGYDPMLEEFGEIIIRVDQEGYEGDSWLLYRSDNANYGYLQFGWGSCSGCDAYEACESIEDVQRLMEHLWQSVKWFGTAVEAYKYFTEKDWSGEYPAEGRDNFVHRVVKYFETECEDVGIIDDVI